MTTTPTPQPEDDLRAIRAALALDPQPWNYDPQRIARLLARLEQAERDAARYRLLRRGQHWSIIDGIGDILRAEVLDEAIDARIAAIASEAKT